MCEGQKLQEGDATDAEGGGGAAGVVQQDGPHRYGEHEQHQEGLQLEADIEVGHRSKLRERRKHQHDQVEEVDEEGEVEQ